MCAWLPESPRRRVGKIKLLPIKLLGFSNVTNCSLSVSGIPCLYICEPFHIKVNFSLALHGQTFAAFKSYLWDEWTWNVVIIRFSLSPELAGCINKKKTFLKKIGICINQDLMVDVNWCWCTFSIVLEKKIYTTKEGGKEQRHCVKFMENIQ